MMPGQASAYTPPATLHFGIIASRRRLPAAHCEHWPAPPTNNVPAGQLPTRTLTLANAPACGDKRPDRNEPDSCPRNDRLQGQFYAGSRPHKMTTHVTPTQHHHPSALGGGGLAHFCFLPPGRARALLWVGSHKTCPLSPGLGGVSHSVDSQPH